jgi:glycogen debranching enzyme
MADEEPQPAAKPSPRRRGARTASEEKDPFYIQATSPQADEYTRVLKHGDTFGVFDHFGDVKQVGMGEEGLFHEGTRYLSGLLLCLGTCRPLFLSSTVKIDNDLLAVDLTNPDVFEDSRLLIPRGTLHLFRSKLLWQGTCYESILIKNYGLTPVATSLNIHFEADFADIFEVRGTHRKRRGRTREPAVAAGGVTLAYEGLDGVVRRTEMRFAPAPAALDAAEARFDVTLRPHDEVTIHVTVACERDDATVPALTYDQALAAVTGARETADARVCSIRTTNDEFNELVNRTVSDLHMMITETVEGPYPYAGVPWFSTPFGRDGIITALECLWLNPGLARGVLAYLAATQATTVSPEQDAEPGKILHETRRGEMAALGEIPFGRYYGSVDSTPLFLMLAGAYYGRTGDLPFLVSLWPHLELALKWIDTYGDPDRDGFVEYKRLSPNGLVQQGWKDSSDSVFHADGTLAEGPIALCEVQGYVFAAKRAMADLCVARNWNNQADDLLNQAWSLQEKFEQAFWCDDLGTYALALDGAKRPCRVRASNAGHCLFAGIATRDRARRTAETLLSPPCFSGWGVRTVATTEIRFNPMSYHNGSIWPHDNALVAAGMARYGLTDAAVEVLTRIVDASAYMDLRRLPELFCGFNRRRGEGPTLYPVACSPQAWAAASVFLLLQSALGLQIDGPRGRISFDYPLLPEFLPEMQILNLRVGSATVDLLLRRSGHDVGVNVLRREGKVEIVTVK